MARAATVDLLGEHTHSHAEADRYASRLADLVAVLVAASRTWPPNDVLERDDLGVLGRVAVAIKPTALAPDFAPLTAEAGISSAARRLLPILESAAADGAQVWFDLERYEVKHLTHRLVRELLTRPELAGLQAGIVVQAYLRDSYEDLAALCEWAARREVPLGIRLVKGAYWDTETVVAEAAGWPVPVYERKPETDANFERCVRLLHSYHGRVRGGVRVPQPPVPRVRDRGGPRRRDSRHRLRGPAPVGHGRARTRGVPAARLPAEGLFAHG